MLACLRAGRGLYCLASARDDLRGHLGDREVSEWRWDGYGIVFMMRLMKNGWFLSIVGIG